MAPLLGRHMLKYVYVSGINKNTILSLVLENSSDSYLLPTPIDCDETAYKYICKVFRPLEL